jgi:hypothetical protein
MMRGVAGLGHHRSPARASADRTVTPVGGLLRAMDGVPAAKRHAPLSMRRDVRSGRVCGAKPGRASATAAIAPGLDAGRSLGLPSGGGLSDQPASLWWAGAPKLPLVPPQRGHGPSWKAGAPPVCEAARHGPPALPQQRRGSSAIARHAVPSSTPAATLVAAAGLAMRTVMRDAGQDPLEPPGGPLAPTCQRMAASGARGRVAPPSHGRHKRSRRLAVWKRCHKAVAP